MKMALQWQVNKNVCIKGSAPDGGRVSGSKAVDLCHCGCLEPLQLQACWWLGVHFERGEHREDALRARGQGGSHQTQESAASQHEVQEGLGERPTRETGPVEAARGGGARHVVGELGNRYNLGKQKTCRN